MYVCVNCVDGKCVCSRVCVVGCGFLSPAVTGYRRLSHHHIHGSAVWSNTTTIILRSGFMIKLQSSMSKHIPVSEAFQHIYI